ncbi:MAG: YfhO family protein [Ferruginibacter sp.]
MNKKITNKVLCGVPVKTWLLLAFICLLGYWPVSSNLFTLKNDAYIYFLPCRYFISETLQSGHLPLWNPYFYMGFPLHGDMQAGVWNPVIWLFSLFGRYNMTMLQYETLLYIFIGGIGIYKLLNEFNITHRSKVIVAVCYMFSGYIIDTAQITVWTGSAAFIPFVFLYYYRLITLKPAAYSNALKTSLALYMLLTAGYPSHLIMAGYILCFAFLCTLISCYRKNPDRKISILFIKASSLAVITFLLLALPAFLSYADYLPYYQRSSAIAISDAQANPFNPFAIISYLFPLSVTKQHGWLTTDPTARSAYMGLFTLLLLVFILKKKFSGTQRFILTATIIIFLFSLGPATPVRKIFYHLVPLTDHFRHPGIMRLFTTLGLLILSSFMLDDFFEAVKDKSTKFYSHLGIFGIIAVVLAMLVHTGNSPLFKKITLFKANFFQAADKRSFIKQFYDSLSFADAVLLEGLIQIIFLALFIYILRKKNILQLKWLAFLFIINPVLLAQFSIPSTFVAQKSPAAINNLIKESPVDFPLPDINTTIETNNFIEAGTNREFGCASFYTKKIVQVKEELNPSFTRSLSDFDSDSLLAEKVMQYPVCYFADTVIRYGEAGKIATGNKKVLFTDSSLRIDTASAGRSSISIKQFAPWGLFFDITITQQKPFVLFQNYNSNWQLLVDGRETSIHKGNISFMYAMINSGRHQLEFRYKPPYLPLSLTVSAAAFLTVIIFLLMQRKKREI